MGMVKVLFFAMFVCFSLAVNASAKTITEDLNAVKSSGYSQQSCNFFLSKWGPPPEATSFGAFAGQVQTKFGLSDNLYVESYRSIWTQCIKHVKAKDKEDLNAYDSYTEAKPALKAYITDHPIPKFNSFVHDKSAFIDAYQYRFQSQSALQNIVKKEKKATADKRKEEYEKKRKVTPSKRVKYAVAMTKKTIEKAREDTTQLYLLCLDEWGFLNETINSRNIREFEKELLQDAAKKMADAIIEIGLSEIDKEQHRGVKKAKGCIQGLYDVKGNDEADRALRTLKKIIKEIDDKNATIKAAKRKEKADKRKKQAEKARLAEEKEQKRKEEEKQRLYASFINTCGNTIVDGLAKFIQLNPHALKGKCVRFYNISKFQWVSANAGLLYYSSSKLGYFQFPQDANGRLFDVIAQVNGMHSYESRVGKNQVPSFKVLKVISKR